MLLPFHIFSSVPAVGLYQLQDGRFQLIKDGPVAPFMAGPGYLLVETALAEFFQSLGLERVKYEPAVVWNRVTDVESHDYVSMAVGQWFSQDQVWDLNLEGDRLLVLADQYSFGSPSLKALLGNACFPYLQFSEGLSGFAG